MKKTRYKLSEDDDHNRDRYIDIFQDDQNVSCYDLQKTEDRKDIVNDLNSLQEQNEKYIKIKQEIKELADYLGDKTLLNEPVDQWEVEDKLRKLIE